LQYAGGTSSLKVGSYLNIFKAYKPKACLMKAQNILQQSTVTNKEHIYICFLVNLHFLKLLLSQWSLQKDNPALSWF